MGQKQSQPIGTFAFHSKTIQSVFVTLPILSEIRMVKNLVNDDQLAACIAVAAARSHTAETREEQPAIIKMDVD